MPHYAIVSVTPTSDDWIPSYLETVTPLVHRHGGRYLARTADHHRLEGDGPSPALQVILEWPSKEAAEAFYNDPEYAPHRDARLAGAVNDFYLVSGVDDFA